ncbi:MAG: phosphopentomutase [Acidobacteria bacterium]|nr:phosphopentomutase [Acidobacteriota bacterium]
MPQEKKFNRIVLIVLDSVGIGEMPDAADYGDAGNDTLGHLFEFRSIQVPNLRRYGLANIRPLNLPPVGHPEGAFGRAAIASKGKDTTTGHWEMAGVVTEEPFPTYPHGFPGEVVKPFEEAIGRKVLGNYPASGTEIIKELGQEHMRTGDPILYTSADSVFQVAAHEEIIPLEELYRICEIARNMLTGKHRVGRVIARPFIGQPGNFKRTEARRDYAIDPPYPTLLDLLKDAGYQTISVGKIGSIFDHRGFTGEIPAGNNMASVDGTLQALKQTASDGAGLIFVNLVDFDMLYGHRNDPEGYARALEAFDARIPEIEAQLNEDDLVMITADHGCDPTTPSTDHSREYVPILACGQRVRAGVDLGIRPTLADMGQTIAENFGVTLPDGQSFLHPITS